MLKKRILSAVLAMLLMTLTACVKNNNPPDYERLKTEILGMWCDIDGPEYVPDDEMPYYRMYEFTSDGRLISHTPSLGMSIYYESEYVLRDNYMTVNNDAMCRINIENDILTMTNNKGDTKYRRMSMEEVCNFQVVFIDKDNYEAQLEYTQDYNINWGDPDNISNAIDTDTAPVYPEAPSP